MLLDIPPEQRDCVALIVSTILHLYDAPVSTSTQSKPSSSPIIPLPRSQPGGQTTFETDGLHPLPSVTLPIRNHHAPSQRNTSSPQRTARISISRTPTYAFRAIELYFFEITNFEWRSLACGKCSLTGVYESECKEAFGADAVSG